MLTRKLVATFAIIAFHLSICPASPPVIPVVPLPQIIEIKNGTFDFDRDNISIDVAVVDPQKLSLGIKELKDELQRGLKREIKFNNKASTLIRIGIPSQDEQFKNNCQRQKLWLDERIGDEGYVLSIDKRVIILAANTDAGLYYGIQTIKQLIRARRNHLPCLKIVDWPNFTFRAVQDDISRGPVPTMEFFKAQIRRCAELKFNNLSYYIEHVVATEKHPEFAPTGGAVSIADLRELSAYAQQYHVQLVGNFQSFGHFEKILAHPQYAHLGEAGRMLTPTKEQSYQLLDDIYSEMAPAFSSPYFSVNCDETWDLGRRESKKLADSLGLAKVYSQHLNKLYKEMRKNNKRMIMWADIALEHPQILDMLPKDVILGTWNYSARDSFIDIIDPLQAAGFDVLVCPGVLNSRRLMPDFKMTRANIRNFVRDGLSRQVMGVLTTVWDDGGSALFSRDWYGVAYAADQVWNSGQESDATFGQRFDKAVYGDTLPSIAQTINVLTELTDLAPTQEMNEKIFWSQIVPARGEKIKLNLSDWQRVRKICDQADSVLSAAEPIVRKTDLDYLRFTVSQYRFIAKSRNDLLAAADSYRQACLSQRENRAAPRHHLLQALEKVQSLRLTLAKLKDQYTRLWLMENRIYWLDHNTEKYDKLLHQFDHAIALLSRALEGFDDGHYLPPPNEVRLDIEEIRGNYFQSWLLCGSFPNPRYTGKEIDYLQSLGGEANAHPTVWSETEWPKGNKVRWRKFTSPKFSEVDLFNYFEPNTRVLAYAYCRIHSDKPQTVRATFGSNDGIEFFLNGEKIFVHHIKRSLLPDEEEIFINLRAGENHLMLKIDQGQGGWGFSFRLPDVRLRNHDYKYRIIGQ